MGLQIKVGLFTALLILGGLKERDKRDIYEIPSDYKGLVYIIKNENCGQGLKKKRGQRIIKIPQDGILVIQADNLHFPFNTPDKGQDSRYNPNVYYQVDNGNKRTELPDMQEKKFKEGLEYKFSKDDIGVFHLGFGTSEAYRPDTVSYSFYRLFIGSYNELKSDKFMFDDMDKSRATEAKLRKCRGE